MKLFAHIYIYNVKSMKHYRLLFQLLIVALSVSIFSLYSKKQKQKKLADFKIVFCAFPKFYTIKTFDHS